MMRRRSLGLLALLAAMRVEAATKPNLVFVLADECAPRIEQLAARRSHPLCSTHIALRAAALATT